MDLRSSGGRWYRNGVLLNTSAAYDSRTYLWHTAKRDDKIFCNATGHYTAADVLRSCAKLYVVGNGKSAPQHMQTMLHLPPELCIVRFNRLTKYPMINDVHVVNRWVSPRGRRVSINLECLQRSRCDTSTLFLRTRFQKQFCSGDPSRGFLFASLFQRFNMTLFAFDDDLSHYMDDIRIWHDASIEHQILKEKYLL